APVFDCVRARDCGARVRGQRKNERARCSGRFQKTKQQQQQQQQKQNAAESGVLVGVEKQLLRTLKPHPVVLNCVSK
ncbi:hypothetical protein AMELA_G00044010, partial [Ameiurus melas]